MGQRIALWQRPGLETTAGDHERRIGILERQPEVDLTDYIRFNYQNGNFGSPSYWFNLVTTAPMPVVGWGQLFTDSSDGGIRIAAAGLGDIELESVNAALRLNGATGAGLVSSGGGIGISGYTSVQILATTADAYFKALAGDMEVTAGGALSIGGGTLGGGGSPGGTLLLSSYDDMTITTSIGNIEMILPNHSVPGDTHFRINGTLAPFPGDSFIVDNAGRVYMPSLPTTDPASGDGQLWYDPVTFQVKMTT